MGSEEVEEGIGSAKNPLKRFVIFFIDSYTLWFFEWRKMYYCDSSGFVNFNNQYWANSDNITAKSRAEAVRKAERFFKRERKAKSSGSTIWYSPFYLFKPLFMGNRIKRWLLR